MRMLATLAVLISLFAVSTSALACEAHAGGDKTAAAESSSEA